MNFSPAGRPKNIAVFASGSGSNAENIINYFNGTRSATVSVVVTNRSDAQVIGRAARLGVPVEVVSREQLADRGCIMGIMDRYSVDVVVLAGFLLMIPGYLIERYRGRMVNIHPSLLPKYGGKGMYGRHVHEAVVAAGERVTGITVHLVDEEYDRGMIIFQAETPVAPGDTPDEVEMKVRGLEAQHFARVIDETFFTPRR